MTTTERMESQSSFEFGKANSRHKIYYWDADELAGKIIALKVALAQQDVKAFIDEQNAGGKKE